jgi:hypothetical protein
MQGSNTRYHLDFALTHEIQIEKTRGTAMGIGTKETMTIPEGGHPEGLCLFIAQGMR